MATLKNVHKIFIIQQLAMWVEPSEIKKALEEDFKIEPTLSQICYYDPKYGKISAELKALYEETRENFTKEIESIPIANEAYRLKVLQRRLSSQLSQRVVNDKLVMELCEQAAKERGRMYTNRREITGANGKPLFKDDPVVTARDVRDELIKLGWNEGEAIKWVVGRYKIAESDLTPQNVSEANN